MYRKFRKNVNLFQKVLKFGQKLDLFKKITYLCRVIKQQQNTTIMKGTKEFQEIRADFEKFVKSQNCPQTFSSYERAPRGAKHFYENGALNAAFLMYMAGYSTARCIYQ